MANDWMIVQHCNRYLLKNHLQPIEDEFVRQVVGTIRHDFSEFFISKIVGIPVWMRSAFIRPSVRLHAVAEFIQKRPNYSLTDLMPLSLQFFGRFSRALASPAKRRFEIPMGYGINQFFEDPQ